MRVRWSLMEIVGVREGQTDDRPRSLPLLLSRTHTNSVRLHLTRSSHQPACSGQPPAKVSVCVSLQSASNQRHVSLI